MCRFTLEFNFISSSLVFKNTNIQKKILGARWKIFGNGKVGFWRKIIQIEYKHRPLFWIEEFYMEDNFEDDVCKRVDQEIALNCVLYGKSLSIGV